MNTRLRNGILLMLFTFLLMAIIKIVNEINDSPLLAILMGMVAFVLIPAFASKLGLRIKISLNRKGR